MLASLRKLKNQKQEERKAAFTRLNNSTLSWVFPGGSAGQESACSAGDPVRFTGWEARSEEGMATLPSTLAWRVLVDREPGGTQSVRRRGRCARETQHRAAQALAQTREAGGHSDSPWDFEPCVRVTRAAGSACGLHGHSPSGSWDPRAHGLLQARTLQWAGTSSSRRGLQWAGVPSSRRGHCSGLALAPPGEDTAVGWRSLLQASCRTQNKSPVAGSEAGPRMTVFSVRFLILW